MHNLLLFVTIWLGVAFVLGLIVGKAGRDDD